MGGFRSTTWRAAGFEASAEALAAALRSTEFGRAPPGFSLVEEPRSMRAVLRGTLAGPDGPVRAIVKWNRPATLADRLARVLRGGRGPREAAAASRLAARGVATPRVLAFSDEGCDFVAWEEVEGLVGLPPAAGFGSRRLVESVAAFVSRLHDAGLVHRDLTRDNLALTPAGPMLVDLGGASVRRALSGRRRVAETGRAAHALLEGASRATRFRALCAYAGGDRGRARALARPVEAAAFRAAIRYRVGRDRRATRTGRHFEAFRPRGGGRAVRAERAPAAWKALVPDLLAGRVPMEREVRRGRVFRATLVARDDPVVVKRFGPVLPLRLPRAVRSFRAGWGLTHRHLDVATPLLAAARAWGPGVLVSEWIDAPSLASRWEASAPGARLGLLESVARTLRAMHEAAVTHRDLKASNLLVVEEGGRRRFPGIDLEGVRIRRRRPSCARRARDLARLDASLLLTEAERAVLLDAYLRVPPRLPVSRERFARRVARRSAWKRERAARRRRADGG